MTALLSWINHLDADGVVLSSSHQEGSLSPSNLADPIIGRRWRTATLTAWGQADFTANVSIGVICLVFPRDVAVPTSGTVQHQFDADGGTAGTGAALDTGAVSIGVADGYGYHLYKPSSPVTARYWRFTFNVSGVSFIDVGRAWAGPAFQPTYDIGFGAGDEWLDPSRVTMAERSGAEYVDIRPSHRMWAFGLNALSDTEKDDIRELDRLAGIRKQILFTKDPSDPSRDTILGRLRGTTPIRHANVQLHTKAFELRESL